MKKIFHSINCLWGVTVCIMLTSMTAYADIVAPDPISPSGSTSFIASLGNNVLLVSGIIAFSVVLLSIVTIFYVRKRANK